MYIYVNGHGCFRIKPIQFDSARLVFDGEGGIFANSSVPHMFTHLLGADKVCSCAKTGIGIGYNGDGGDDDGKREESLGNHFV